MYKKAGVYAGFLYHLQLFCLKYDKLKKNLNL